MTFLPDEAVEELKCTTCKNYLSYLPVYEHNETGIVLCGRCLTPDYEDKYQRNTLYEKLAKYTLFPCKFKNEGCKEILYPSDIQEHEGSCIFKPLNCPLEDIEDCSWNGCHFQLTDHFKKFHKELVIANNKVDLCFSEDFNKKYLLINNEASEDELFDKMFIINMTCQNYRFNCVVYYFGPRRLELSSITLVLNSADFDFPEVVPLYRCNYNERNNNIGSAIIIPLNTVYVIGTFNIFESYSIIKQSNLSCFFCLKYEEEEILSCKKGHNVCEGCTTYHSENCSFTDLSVNQKLIQMVTELKFNCRNRKKGCIFFCNKEETLQIHQKICVFNADKTHIRCVNCRNILLNYRSLLNHSKQKCLNITDDNTLNQWDLTQTPNHSLAGKTYKIYDNYIFVAYRWVENNMAHNMVNVYVELLHQKEMSGNYNYEIRLLNPVTKAEIMTARQAVRNLDDVHASGYGYVKVNQTTLEHAIQGNIIGYMIKILKK